MEDGRRSVTVTWKGQTVSSQSLRRLRQSEHRLSVSVSNPTDHPLPPRQSRQHFGSAMLSRAPQLPESHYQNCQSAGSAAAIDAQVDRRRNGERGRNSECETIAASEGIDRSTLDDDQTGLTFIAKSSPSSCRRCVHVA